jgi:hypothetical protein
MSIAVPVAILVLLSAQVYKIWPSYEPEQKDKSEQTDKSSEEKDKSGQADESSLKKDKSGKSDKSSSATVSKGRQHPLTKGQD